MRFKKKSLKVTKMKRFIGDDEHATSEPVKEHPTSRYIILGMHRDYPYFPFFANINAMFIRKREGKHDDVIAKTQNAMTD